MHVLHVFNVIKATNTLSEKNLGCRFVEQVVTQKRAFFLTNFVQSIDPLGVWYLSSSRCSKHIPFSFNFTFHGNFWQTFAGNCNREMTHPPSARRFHKLRTLWRQARAEHALTTMETVLNDPDWSTGSGRVLTTCKFNDSLRDSCSCFVRCEIFLFNWPVRMQTRKCASIFFHLIVSSTRFRHMCQQSPRVPYHQITKKLYEGELAQQKHQFLVFYHPHKPPGQRFHWKQSFSKTLPMRINLKTPPWRFRLDGRKKKDLYVKLNVKAS